MPTSRDYHDAKFFVREGGRIVATPLAVVLVAIEASDLMFAMDSIPAIFAITTDPLIIYTSNVVAILGLRSVFFVLSGVLGRFERLSVGLALVLAFVGVKMIIAPWLEIPIAVSLAVIAAQERFRLVPSTRVVVLLWPGGAMAPYSYVSGSVLWSVFEGRNEPAEVSSAVSDRALPADEPTVCTDMAEV